MPRSTKSERILVVDDDELVLETLRILLAERWRVHLAQSAGEARRILDLEEISVLIADQRMPCESGVELMSWCRTEHPDVIRILLTGYTDLDTIIQAINQGGVWHYIEKPWNNAYVLTLVQRAVEYRNKDLLARRRFQGSIRSLVAALEASHPYTSGHSTRVTRYTHLLCECLSLPSREIEDIVLAAQLHDIGKLGVDNRYLDKEGELSEEEWKNVRRHVTVGRKILLETGFLDSIVPMVESHHEKMDGSGYPLGLSGEAIPIGGRIIALADAFDAMTSDRAYRAALGRDVALAELRENSGTHFDPELVEVFCSHLPREIHLVPGGSLQHLIESLSRKIR